MHVLYDESNSLVENNAQHKDVEMGLVKKDLLLIHQEGKNFQVGSGTEPISKKEGKVLNKQGELLLNSVWSRIIFKKQAPE